MAGTERKDSAWKIIIQESKLKMDQWPSIYTLDICYVMYTCLFYKTNKPYASLFKLELKLGYLTRSVNCEITLSQCYVYHYHTMYVPYTAYAFDSTWHWSVYRYKRYIIHPIHHKYVNGNRNGTLVSRVQVYSTHIDKPVAIRRVLWHQNRVDRFFLAPKMEMHNPSYSTDTDYNFTYGGDYRLDS